MPAIMAIDTATEACSAALLLDDEVVERYEIAPRRHAELILSMVDRLLAEAGITPQRLDALAFGRGPGAFTGVRIATGVVQGIAFGADLPVVPISTLAAMAQGAWRVDGRTRMLAAIDARMREVYWGCYEMGAEGTVQLQDMECVRAPSQVPLPEGGEWFGVGSGWGAYGDVLVRRLGPRIVGADAGGLPHAHDVAVLGAAGFRAGLAVAPEEALPVYLRDQVVARSIDQI